LSKEELDNKAQDLLASGYEIFI